MGHLEQLLAAGRVQIRAVPSLLPVAIRVPSGLNATVSTEFSGHLQQPRAASQIRAVPSLLAVAIRVPSGLKATAFTELPGLTC
jgi:hypothetical protein